MGIHPKWWVERADRERKESILRRDSKAIFPSRNAGNKTLLPSTKDLIKKCLHQRRTRNLRRRETLHYQPNNIAHHANDARVGRLPARVV
jgi:hypothetical protein